MSLLRMFLGELCKVPSLTVTTTRIISDEAFIDSIIKTQTL